MLPGKRFSILNSLHHMPGLATHIMDKNAILKAMIKVKGGEVR
jgi:hypothetical protein